MEREYFCMLNIEVKKLGGVQRKLVERVIDADPDKVDAQGLFGLACDEVTRYLLRYEDLNPGDYDITGFSFYPNQLPG